MVPAVSPASVASLSGRAIPNRGNVPWNVFPFQDALWYRRWIRALPQGVHYDYVLLRHWLRVTQGYASPWLTHRTSSKDEERQRPTSTTGEEVGETRVLSTQQSSVFYKGSKIVPLNQGKYSHYWLIYPSS